MNKRHELEEWIEALCHWFCRHKPKLPIITIRLGQFSITFEGNFVMNLAPGFKVVASVAWDNPPQSPPVWASDSPAVSVASAADGNSAVITYVAAGTASITATATNPDATKAVATGLVIATGAVGGANTTRGDMIFGTPTPIGSSGPSLAASYPDLQSFADAVAAYTGPEDVTLDGAEVRTGTLPALNYVSNPNGSISKL